jgi:hypothetical protein
VSKPIFTTEDLSVWRQTAEMRGLKVRIEDRDDREDETEWFAEAEDVTMCGYFSEGWGMLT